MAMYLSDVIASFANNLFSNNHHIERLRILLEVSRLFTTGPYKKVPDLGGYEAKYLLVGALTWILPTEGADKLTTDDEVPEVEDEAPKLEEEGQEELEDKKEKKGGVEDQVLQLLEEERQRDNPVEAEAQQEENQEGEAEAKEDEEKKEEGQAEEEKKKRMRTRVFELLCPLVSKNSPEVTKGL